MKSRNKVKSGNRKPATQEKDISWSCRERLHDEDHDHDFLCYGEKITWRIGKKHVPNRGRNKPDRQTKN